MLTTQEFYSLLDSKGVLIVDGALATELECRGHNLNHALWSAKLLKEDPASIQQVHLDYFIAGADVAITASYQAATQGLADHFGLDDDGASELVKASVQLALNARAAAHEQGIDHRRKLLVAGSVGPYGAYLSDGSEYRGDYVRSSQEFRDFHRRRIQVLVEAGVDLLALETIPNLTEIEALLQLLQEDFPTSVAWLSCTSRDADHLSDGSTWDAVLDVVRRHTNQIVAFGVNCVPFDSVTSTLQRMRALTNIPLICYPNSGESWDAQAKVWIGTRPDDSLSAGDETPSYRPGEQASSHASKINHDVSEWVHHGARLVGGCCRTGPAFVKTVSRHVGAGAKGN